MVLLASLAAAAVMIVGDAPPPLLIDTPPDGCSIVSRCASPTRTRVAADGGISVQGRPVTIDRLAASLAGITNKRECLFVIASSDAPYTQVEAVLGVLADAGVPHVALIDDERGVSAAGVPAPPP